MLDYLDKEPVVRRASLRREGIPKVLDQEREEAMKACSSQRWVIPGCQVAEEGDGIPLVAA